jgi:Domain of unknown function (DUF4249)
MTQHIIRIALTCLLALSLTACARTQTEEILTGSSHIPVVIGILSSGDTISISLIQTLVTGTTPNNAPYPEARVFISVQDSAWKELKRIRKDSCVFIDTTKNNKALIGKTYRLKVDIGTTTLTATTQVPPDEIKITDAFFEQTVVYYNDSINGKPNIIIDGKTHITQTTNNGNNYRYNCKVEYSSGDYSSSRFQIDITKETNVFEDFLRNDSISMTACIETVNNDLYNLGNTIGLEGYNTSITKNNPAGVLIAMMNYSGTMPQYSNINNGYGLFSAYTNGKKFPIRKIAK